MRLIARDEWWKPNPWVPSVPRWTAMGPRQPDVFLHHVGGPCPADLPSLDWLNQFEQSALAAGAARGDHYIALEYHVGIFASGVMYQARPDGVEGGATLDHNGNSYAIVLMGDYTKDRVTDAQVDAIRWLISQWEAENEVISPPNLRPHSAVYATACPGDNARARIPEMVSSEEDDLDSTQNQLLVECHEMLSDVKAGKLVVRPANGVNTASDIVGTIQTSLKQVVGAQGDSIKAAVKDALAGTDLTGATADQVADAVLDKLAARLGA